MNRQAPTPVPAPVGAHNFLGQMLSRMPKDAVGSQSDIGDLRETRISATAGTTQQEELAKKQMNFTNGQMALPQNRPAQVPALVPDTISDAGQKHLQKFLLGNTYTEGEKADIAALQSRLPVA